MKWKLRSSNIIFYLVVIAFLSATSVVYGDSNESKSLFIKAQSLIVKFLPKARLVMYGGKLSTVEGCTTQIDWRFIFHEDESQDRMAAGGVAELYNVKTIDGNCNLLGRVFVDTDLDFPGYNYLASNGNLDKVKIELWDALKVVKNKFPDSKWQGRFLVNGPLVPDFKDRVFYTVFIDRQDKPDEVFVDATTGEIQDR